ncbi:hypothetical protein [Streptomyces sp. NPDC057253]|uniref:hypothetical protein n=1 Tax=Streptomyces sp. NPDC057253 TaxID=3346069 RepID=UPI0036297A6C
MTRMTPAPEVRRRASSLLDASGIGAPTAMYTAAGAHMPSAAQQFAALERYGALR